MFFRLLLHCVRRAASRAAWMAGNSKATKIPMMAITTNNSTRVNAAWRRLKLVTRVVLGMAWSSEKRKRNDSKHDKQGDRTLNHVAIHPAKARTGRKSLRSSPRS